MLLNVNQYGDPVLRAVSAPVEHVDDELKTLVENMLETMYATEGIGLAAPQVGLNIRLVVIDIPEDEEEGTEPEMIMVNGEEKPMRSIMPLVFINPEIEPYGKQYLFTEGCLSVRNIRANVARPEFVKARLPQLRWPAGPLSAARVRPSGWFPLCGPRILCRQDYADQEAQEARLHALSQAASRSVA